MNAKKIKTILCLNVCLFIFEFIGIAWMISGFGKGDVLAIRGLNSLKYFTVDSNIIIGFISLYISIELLIKLKKNDYNISTMSYILFLVGCVGVTLTFLVTVFFLEPTMGPKFGWFSLFTYSNFFLHLLNPILSIVIFLVFMRNSKIKFKYSFAGIIPMFIYAIYYAIMCLLHVEDGKVIEGYDWYGFLVAGVNYIYLVVPLMVAITYGISFVLYKLNKIKE